MFDHEYVSQIFIEINKSGGGMFWNSQDKQIPKLSLDFQADQLEKKTQIFGDKLNFSTVMFVIITLLPGVQGWGWWGWGWYHGETPEVGLVT